LRPVVGPTISAFHAIRSVRSFYRFLQGGRCVILDRRHLSHPRVALPIPDAGRHVNPDILIAILNF
jgi:hypothetical protein